jgi:CubicO group peptidase (beta-lactamase class C family)
MKEIHGHVAPGYEAVRQGFAEGEANDPGGAQLSVWRHGEEVVDIWTGEDPVKHRPFDRGTITVLMSCTKAAVAVCANMLADRGLLDVDAPVARYWPEFAANGKSEILVRHLLTHTAGLMGYDPEFKIGVREMLDPVRSVEAIERLEPFWSPGEASLYHFATYGVLVGEVIRRITGKSVGRYFADNVAGPLKLDLWIGLPASEEHRVAAHFRPVPRSLTPEQWRALFSGMGLDPDSRMLKALIHTFTTVESAIEFINTPEGHAAEFPAGNGIGNAHSLARMYAACLGEADGVRLLSREAMDRARTPRTDGLPQPRGFSPFRGTGPQRFGLGFELPRDAEPMLGPGSFGHAGAGGRMAFAHPGSGTAVAYVCNGMLWDDVHPDDRWVPWTRELKKLL